MQMINGDEKIQIELSMQKVWTYSGVWIYVNFVIDAALSYMYLEMRHCDNH